MLARKVARLMAGTNHQGSAWLICEEYALTALHCVQSDDGVARDELSLMFPGQAVHVAVDIVEAAKSIDVALLRLKTPIPDDHDLVINLSRGSVALMDELAIHGHPSASAFSSPEGITVFCTVTDPAHPYIGTKGALSLMTVAMRSDTTTPGTSGGQKTSGLKGASGGVVARKAWGDSESAIGLLIEDSQNGDTLHAVPISAIAKCFPQVQAALERSSHVDTRSPRILLRVTESGRIQWSGSLTPSEVSQLWDINPMKQGQLRMSISAKLRELGPADDALLRLSAYANLRSLRIPDGDAWAIGLKKLEDFHRQPDTPIQFDTGVEEESCPASWKEFSKEELANLIHATLDCKILEWLSDELYECLKYDKATEIGEKIEANLKNLMWIQWSKWRESLRTDAALLQHFLSRVFDVNANAHVTQSNFASIGFCKSVRQELLRATLFGLALDAAGVPTTPRSRDIGNLDVAELSGHACGISKRDQQDLRRFAKSVEWKSDVVFLPYLPMSLLHLYERSTPMTRADGTEDHSFTQVLPIALTAEDEFLDALKGGAQRVKDFYLKQETVREMRLAALKVPGRTEPLDV